MKNKVIYKYKRNARLRHLEWTIASEQFFALTQQQCHYCGIPPANETKDGGCNGSFIYNGVDRKNNSVGYVDGNVVPCCTLCNRLKRGMPYEKFASYLDRVATYRKGRTL